MSEKEEKKDSSIEKNQQQPVPKVVNSKLPAPPKVKKENEQKQPLEIEPEEMRRLLQHNHQRQQTESRLKDVEASKAFERISINIAKTMKVADSSYNMYHDETVVALRRLEKGLRIENRELKHSPKNITELIKIYGAEYVDEQMDKDLDKCRKFIDKVWNSWTYFEDTQIVSLSQYIFRSLLVTLAVTKSKYGFVDFTKYSFSLIGLYHVYVERIKPEEIDNQLGIWGWIEKSKQFFDQFDIRTPPNLHEIRDKREKEKKIELEKKLKAKDEQMKGFEDVLKKQHEERERQLSEKMNFERRQNLEKRRMKTKDVIKENDKKKKVEDEKEKEEPQTPKPGIETGIPDFKIEEKV